MIGSVAKDLFFVVFANNFPEVCQQVFLLTFVIFSEQAFAGLI